MPVSRLKVLTVTALLAGGGVAWLALRPGPDLPASKRAENSRTTGIAAAVATDWRAEISAAKVADLPGLIRRALRIPNASERKEVLSAMLTKFMNEDLRSFIALLDEIDADSGELRANWDALAPALLEALPKVNDRAALSSSLNEIVQRALAHLAETDPDAALAWANEWLLDDARQQAMATVVEALVSTQPDAAVELFDQISSPLRRMEALDAVGGELARENPDAAIRWARSLRGPSEIARGMNRVLIELAVEEPDVASQKLTAFRTELQAEYTTRVAAERAALGTTARDQLNDPSSDAALTTLDGGAIPDPVSPDVELLEESTAAIAKQLAADDPAAALAWAATLGHPALERTARQAAFVSWSMVDPAGAAHELAQSPAAPEITATVYSAWAEKDPTAAASQVAAISDPAQRREATHGVVSGWLDTGRTADVIAWVDRATTGPDRDEANASVVDALIEEAPKSALDRASKITDPKIRADALQNSFAALLADDVTVARTALATGGFSKSDTAMLGKLLRAASPAAQP